MNEAVAKEITLEELEGATPILCPHGCGCPAGYLTADGKIVVKVRHHGQSHYVELTVMEFRVDDMESAGGGMG